MAKQRQIQIDYLDKTVVSPAMEINWVYLTKPDEAFGKADYKVTVVNPPEDFINKLIEIENTYRESHGKKATKQHKWLAEDANGNPKITFKSSKQPPCYDARVKPIEPKNILSGSTVKVEIQPGWCETGVYTGMVWYLQGVQLLKKGTGNFGASSFGVEDDYLDDAEDTNEAPFEAEPEDIDEADIDLDEEDLLV